MIVGAIDTVESRLCSTGGNAHTALSRKHGRIALNIMVAHFTSYNKCSMPCGADVPCWIEALPIGS